MHTWLAVLRRLSSVTRKGPAKYVIAALTHSHAARFRSFRSAERSGRRRSYTCSFPISPRSVSWAWTGHKLLTIGLIFCALRTALRPGDLPSAEEPARAPLDAAIFPSLIYETCKTYLVTQGKFLMILWAFIAVVILAYFGWLAPVPG